jgi:hypothetical protein
MSNLQLSSFVTTTLAAVLFASVIGLGDSPQRLSGLLSESDYNACGLSKLTADEADRLFELLCVPRTDFLGLTAFERMEQDGWVPVDLIGYGARHEETSWPEEFLVFARAGLLYRFKRPMGDDDLEPGRYWAKADSRVWTLMRPDASTENLWPLGDD